MSTKSLGASPVELTVLLCDFPTFHTTASLESRAETANMGLIFAHKGSLNDGGTG